MTYLRKTLHGKTIFRAMVAIAVAAIATGAIYQARGEAADAERFPPPGELISVGDYRLHLYCTGEGQPAVVLDALAGGLSPQWGWVQPLLAGTTRVCSFDRAGRGWSDPASPRDLWGAAEDLHTLLRNAGVPGPVVQAGHSIGGLYARAYAARYPKEIAGLALIDSSHPEQFERYPEMLDSGGIVPLILPSFPWLARVGLFRYYFSTGGEIDFAGLPPQQHAQMAAFWSSPRYFDNSGREYALAPRIYEQAHELPKQIELPLTVVSAGEHAANWKALQQDLAGLSDNATHVTVDGANHGSLVFQPDHAKVVAGAIAQLVEQARHN
jgi:pimeloyl-ACP methyl ester carboxylesterase